jgi:hypothetical protein
MVLWRDLPQFFGSIRQDELRLLTTCQPRLPIKVDQTMALSIP